MKSWGGAVIAIALVTTLGPVAPAFAEIQLSSVLVKLLDQADVPAREAGVLMSLPVQEGSLVEQDGVLATIDDREARLFAERAELELKIATRHATSKIGVQSAEKALRVAEDELQRAQESVASIKNSISKTELDRLQLAVEQGRFALDKARQDLQVAGLARQLKQVEAKTAQRNVERREIQAPFPGVVVQLHRRRGEWVEPGEKLLRLIRLDRLRAEGVMPAVAAADDLVGSTVQLTVVRPNLPELRCVGKVTFVSPEIDPVNGTVRVLAEIDNSSLELRPGMKGGLTIAPP